MRTEVSSLRRRESSLSRISPSCGPDESPGTSVWGASTALDAGNYGRGDSGKFHLGTWRSLHESNKNQIFVFLRIGMCREMYAAAGRQREMVFVAAPAFKVNRRLVIGS